MKFLYWKSSTIQILLNITISKYVKINQVCNYFFYFYIFVCKKGVDIILEYAVNGSVRKSLNKEKKFDEY